MTSLIERVAPARLGPSFRWLMLSSWASNLSDGIALAAGPLLVAAQTRDAFLVALATVLQRVPWLAFALVAGVIADRLDRKRIVIVVSLLRTTVLLVLSAAIVTDVVSIWVVLTALFLLGTAEVFADTTSQTLLPMVVDKADLGIGNARLMAGFITVNQLAGPPIGAALFALGLVVPFVAQATCIAFAALLVSRVVLPPHGRDPQARRSHLRRDITEGLRWLWNHAAVRTLTVTIVIFNVTYGASWSVLVLYAVDILDAGAVGFGLLTTAGAVGGLLGTALYGWVTARVSLGNIMRGGLVIETLTHLAFALTRHLWVALVIMFVFGAHAFIWGTTSRAVRQRAVPTGLQGRVGSVYLLGVFGGMVVGGLVGGVVAGAWGVLATFWFGFAGSALLVVAIWQQLPHIAHADAEALADP
ncbi:MFS transporter [Intrasporangium sp.]|uniref:MFS transporter n=1 Tax=Intrasporangium sp. TaxID=1925024 RepID=UPI00293AC014|nr:MFS transporter [Intrasporangium sp.]MDV3222857.1 MFS transporter [Intrasporangium sp.]